jgi:xanthine dehydrogenase large subunit
VNVKSPLHLPALHESGYRHASGEARYVDDLPTLPGTLVAAVVPSPHARARITRRCARTARSLPGVHAVLFVDDIPGDNLIGPIVHDEPLLAEGEVFTRGQAVALVVGESYAACRAAAAAVEVDYQPLAPLLSIQEAIFADSFHTPPHVIARGEVDATLAASPVRIRAEVASGGQRHFYLETQASLAVPEEGGRVRIYSSTQHPTECQRMAARVLGVSHSEVTCEVPRLGGGFGGKESQATQYACLAALGVQATGRPVKLWLDRDADMQLTGGRHPFWSTYEAGFDEEGRLLALAVKIYSDGGWSADLSGPVMDRALFHLDSAYYLPALRFEGRVCRTNLPSNTAFRGFGGPQGMLVVEDAIERFAERRGVDPAAVRALNLYGDAPRDVAPYGQVIANNRMPRVWDELLERSDYAARRAQIDAFNAGARRTKRGIGVMPVKFGISFTASLLNQAGALVLVYADGTVQLNHGGTEMGQGLHTKMLAVCADELGVSVERVRVMQTATDKVPNTSATAASSGSDLNGQAVRHACAQLRARMAPVAARMMGLPEHTPLRFGGDRVYADSGESAPFARVANACWVNQVSLAASGFYATPGIGYDASVGRGRPFFYFAFGAAAVEVEVCGLTGEHRVRRVDILHDVGDSLVPTIDRGQIEGAFIQGLGWLTGEEVLFDGEGRLLTHGPSTYKIPSAGDAPADFRVALLDRAPQPEVVGGSKAVGEPPFMLAIGVIGALRHAVGAFRGGGEVELRLPCTPEAILRAITHPG